MLARANHAAAPGIQTVTTALAVRPDGTRGLYIAPECAHTLGEYAVYAWEGSSPPDPLAPRGEGEPAAASGALVANVSERPLKASDHALDATRYALHTELGRLARAEAYLAALRARVGERR